MALAVKIALWPAAGGYHYRTGEFQLLLSVDERPAGVDTIVAAAMVVVTEVSTGNSFLEGDD